MKCLKCGNVNDAKHANFCIKCGCKLDGSKKYHVTITIHTEMSVTDIQKLFN